MNRLFAVAIFALFGCAGCDVTSYAPDHITEQQEKKQQCSWIIASHRSILESWFEEELYSITDKDDWHGALKTLNVATNDSGGHPRDPSSVLQSTIDKLVQVKNAADRMRLEYFLLGSRMSLEERRRFDDYCVVAVIAQ